MKMTKLTRYLFGDESAKTITTRTIDRQHWYMASAICGLLGISNHSRAVHYKRITDELTLTDQEKCSKSVYIGGYGKKHILLVNNGGLLKLIFQAKTQAALEVQSRIAEIPNQLIPAEWADYLTEA
jgi:prophage antirepressor-like protein